MARTERTLQDLAKAMARIDFAMLQTHAANGEIAGRPMSNNGDVEYDGDSYFFGYEGTHFVGEIEANPAVALSFTGAKSLLGKPPLFVAVEGRGELIRDKALMQAHWHKELDRWFEQAVDTPGIVMLKVHARRITWWEGMDEGEIRL
ncbi:general stress protein 26 [Luteibacter sp. 621]|uniref:pyridoxamine 5'-phosphate oxidase family protein n=1 Tax=Luteibacter sp. 621 TaxID=3373916 RepID=UPI003D1D5C45